MSRAGEGLFRKYLPKGMSEKIRKVLEFKPEDPNRSWQVPRANAPTPGLENHKFRSPAPNSQPQANVPISDNPDLLYDITYYKRDTKRAAPKEIYTYVAPALSQLADERTKALELLAPKVGPDEKRPEPSQGNKNPAVMKYDPTGLRTTMSTSNKEWEESLKKYMPTHNVKPWWWKANIDIMAEAEAKGLPLPPGKRMQWDAPPGSKVASW